MDGNVFLVSDKCIHSTHVPLDFILTVCDFAAQFLYVKVAMSFNTYECTKLMSFRRLHTPI